MLRFVALTFLISLVLPVAAAERIDIFTSSVQVDTQQEAERKLAFVDALKRVVVKVTGDAQYLEDPALEPLLSKAQRYVAGFSYQRNILFNGTASLNEISETAGSEDGLKAVFAESVPEKEYVLTAQFEDEPLLSHIRELGLPVWGALRPSIIAWVVMQRDGERHLINSDYADLSASLNRESERSGLPVFLPVGDLEDLSSVDLNELWGLFPSSVQQASQRYPSDFKLLARVFQAEEGLELKWSLLLGGSIEMGRAKALDYHALWSQMTAGIAKKLAQQFAVVSDPMANSQELSIVVSGIEQFVDYAGLVEHLERLSSVEGVSVQQIFQDEVGLGIRLRGSRSNFEQQVSLAGKLRMVAPQFFSERQSGGVDNMARAEGEGLVLSEPEGLPVSLNFYWVPNGGA